MRRSNPASPKTERMPPIKFTARSPCIRFSGRRGAGDISTAQRWHGQMFGDESSKALLREPSIESDIMCDDQNDRVPAESWTRQSILLFRFITRQQCESGFSKHHYVDGPISRSRRLSLQRSRHSTTRAMTSLGYWARFRRPALRSLNCLPQSPQRNQADAAQRIDEQICFVPAREADAQGGRFRRNRWFA